MNDHVHFMTILCSVLIYYACFMAVLEHRSMIIVFIEQRHAQESRLVHITHSQPSLAFSQEPPWVPSCLFSAGFFSARGPAETLTLVERAVTGNLGKWLIVDTFFLWVADTGRSPVRLSPVLVVLLCRVLDGGRGSEAQESGTSLSLRISRRRGPNNVQTGRNYASTTPRLHAIRALFFLPLVLPVPLRIL